MEQIFNEYFLDSTCINIKKDVETAASVDYFFETDLYSNDPRNSNRKICVGNVRGLLRIYIPTLDGELLKSMPYDYNNSCYQKAYHKIISSYNTRKEFPDNTGFYSG